MQEQASQKLGLTDRKHLNVSGVTEILGYDEETVVLITAMGELHIHGTGLKLQNLSLEMGQVTVDGTVSALIFEEPRTSLWHRLLG